MRTSERGPVQRNAAPAILLAALLAGVFVVPYLFPPSSPILSASALAGFNNALAYDWYVVALGLLACVLAPRMSATDLFPEKALSRPLFGVPPWTVLFIMAGHVAVFAALYLQKHGFVFADALYFEDAAYRVHAGQLPFVDFNFFYGPLLVYPAAALARYAGIPLGYAAYYTTVYVAGLYLLYVVMSSIIENRRHLVIWFALFAVGFFNPMTGLNYTFSRFMLPLISLMAIWRFHRAFTIGRWLTAVLLLAVAILCSPDIAAVTVIGVIVLIALIIGPGLWSRRIGSDGAVAAIPAVGLLLAVVPLLLIDGTWRPVQAYLMPIVTFSAGGWSTPIDPSLPMLTLIGCTIFVAACFWSAYRRPELRGSYPLLAAYAATLVLMQRAIFGKADVLHIAYSGLPAYLAVVASASPSRAWRGASRWVAVALVIGVIVPLQFFQTMLFLPSLVSRLSAPRQTYADAAPPVSASKEAVQASIARAVDHFGKDRLYYMHKLEYYRLPVYLQYELRPFLYHPSLTSAFTSRDIEDVIGELKKSGAIVLARRADLVLSTPPAPLTRHWWYFATSSPLPGSMVYDLTLEFQFRLERPLVEHLVSAYDTRFEDGDIVGLALRDSL